MLPQPRRTRIHGKARIGLAAGPHQHLANGGEDANVGRAVAMILVHADAARSQRRHHGQKRCSEKLHAAEYGPRTAVVPQ